MNSIGSPKRNLGIDFLKVWMSFEVVLCHYGHGSEEFLFRYFFSYFRSIAVPVFMVISFYLSACFLLSREGLFYKLNKRLLRIYQPLFVWAVIYWTIYNAIAFFGNVNDLYIPIKSLFWQIVTGHSYNTAMWFNVVLAWLTISFFFITTCSNKSTSIIMLMSLFAVFVSQSGLNSAFMLLPDELCFPMGRIAECIPYAGFGLILYKCQCNKEYYLLILFVVSVFFVHEFCGRIFNGEIIGYHYNGMTLFACSTLLVSLFVFVPFRKTPDFIRRMINFLSHLSMGIYCIHILIGTLLGFLKIEIDPFFYSLLIYFVSLVLCFCISKIPCKLFKDIVS